MTHPYRSPAPPESAGDLHVHYCPACRVAWPCRVGSHFTFDGPRPVPVGVVMKCAAHRAGFAYSIEVSGIDETLDALERLRAKIEKDGGAVVVLAAEEQRS